MALDDSALLEMIEMLRTADGGELMRRLLGGMLQGVVDAEAAAHIGAQLHERSDLRTTQRNGTRDKLVTTGVGDLTVKIPKVRTGSFFPALLCPRRRIDVALHAVVMQAYVEGVSTRRVDDLVIAMGGTGISKSEVSRICAQLDAEVAIWRTRTLDHTAFPYVFLDATYCKVRLNRRVVSQAVVIATGVSADGRREVLGCATGDSETEVFWTEFLRDLRDRGLTGVQLVISDAHSGLVNAIGTVMQGVSWQRCRVHFMRNVLAKVSKGHAEMVAATIRTIFAQPGPQGGPGPGRPRRRHAGRAVPRRRRDAAGRQGRPDRVRGLPARRTGARSGAPTPSSGSTARSSAAPTSSGSSPTPQPCSGCRAACSSRPTTSGKTATAAT